MANDITASAASTRWLGLPAWIFSLAVHLTIVVLAVLFIRPAPPTKGFDDQDRPAAIVLVKREAGQTKYFDDEQSAVASAAQFLAAAGATSPAAGDPLSGAAAPAPAAGIALPELPGNVASGQSLVPGIEPGAGQGRTKLPFAMIDEEAVLAADALVPREVQPTGPTAKLSLFGSAQAEGRSFVFVIDRSQSMGGDGLGAIAAAAKELSERIGALTPEQTFQVVTFNQSAAYFSGRELVPATDENKASLIKFIAGTVAVGPTEHERGLRAALRLKPEVIFLLTDGGDPHLKPAQCAAIRDQAAGRTSIHCLHFGRGREDEAASDHFLRRLAAENRGSYVYIDMR
jgi:hypothetical protein